MRENDEFCESDWPSIASPSASSGFANLRRLARRFGQFFFFVPPRFEQVLLLIKFAYQRLSPRLGGETTGNILRNILRSDIPETFERITFQNEIEKSFSERNFIGNLITLYYPFTVLILFSTQGHGSLTRSTRSLSSSSVIYSWSFLVFPYGSVCISSVAIAITW